MNPKSLVLAFFSNEKIIMNTVIKVPLANVVLTQPASRKADPPAQTTNAAYEMAEINSANSVPFGIDEAGSFKSPEIFAPA